MNNTLAATPDPRPVLIALLVRSVASPHSKAAYENALRTFLFGLGPGRSRGPRCSIGATP